MQCDFITSQFGPFFRKCSQCKLQGFTYFTNLVIKLLHVFKRGFTMTAVVTFIHVQTSCFILSRIKLVFQGNLEVEADARSEVITVSGSFRSGKRLASQPQALFPFHRNFLLAHTLASACSSKYFVNKM